MFKSNTFIVWLVLLTYSFSLPGFSADWDPKNRVPIRSQILNCETYLALAEPEVNDSVGVRLSTNDVSDFKEQMGIALQEQGKSKLVGSHLFITGVEMGKENETEASFRQALSELGFTIEEIRVRVLSIPAYFIKGAATNLWKNIYQRLVFNFLPSISRHYQAPTRGEISSGFLSTVAIEVPNVVFLYKHLPLTDANLTVAVHVATLAAYTIYKKFMVNWLIQPGTSHLELFLKQILLSFPFVANYNVFGNFSNILQFYKTNGWDATLARFPAEIANFSTTQGLTLFLQTLFYSIVISNGVRGWENSQGGTKRSDDARTVANWIAAPILALDSVFLAMAASGGTPIAELGPLDVNMGHAALAATTILGSSLWLWPKLLDPFLTGYDALRSFLGKAKSLIFRKP